MPEKGKHEHYDGDEVRHLEEFVAEVSDTRVSWVQQNEGRSSPDDAMRHESKPSLADKCHNSSPVEQQISGEVALHVVPVNVVYDEWKCV